MTKKILNGPSRTIEEHLAEAKKLIDLKSDIGRLPSSNLKKGLLQLIEDWFNQRTPSTAFGQGHEREPNSDWQPPAWKQALRKERLEASSGFLATSKPPRSRNSDPSEDEPLF